MPPLYSLFRSILSPSLSIHLPRLDIYAVCPQTSFSLVPFAVFLDVFIVEIFKYRNKKFSSTLPNIFLNLTYEKVTNNLRFRDAYLCYYGTGEK